MPFATLEKKRSINMYYEVHGEARETLVMINGLKSDHTGWAPMLAELAKNFRIVLLDNRAIGQTTDDEQPFSIEEMAEDVASLMDYLKISSACIVGHSMGGAIAQVMAFRYPERVKQLFLCNTFVKFNETSRAAFQAVLQAYEQNASREMIMDMIIPWVFSDGFMTPDLRALIHSAVKADPLWQSKANYARQLAALNTFNSAAWVEQIAVPTIVVGSKVDKTALFSESEELVRRIKGAKLRVLEGGHASAVEQGAAFSALMMAAIPRPVCAEVPSLFASVAAATPASVETTQIPQKN